MVKEELQQQRKKQLIIFQRRDWQKVVDSTQLVGDLADRLDLGTPLDEIIRWNVYELLSGYMLNKQFATDRFGRRYFINNISPAIDIRIEEDSTGDTIAQGRLTITFDFDLEKEPGED
jgi:hypothetical protein